MKYIEIDIDNTIVGLYLDPADGRIEISDAEFEKIGDHSKFIDGKVTAPRPSPAHEWDIKKAAWIENKALLVELAQQQAERDAQAKIKSMQDFVQAYLDQTARDQGLGFDDIKSAMLGAQFPGDHQAASQALGAWYYSVWAACKSLLHQWQSGMIDEPNADDVMAALPKYIAPQADK